MRALILMHKNSHSTGAKLTGCIFRPTSRQKTFWSLVLYDTRTRSMLQTNQQFPSIGSQKKGVVVNPDMSVDVHFAPKGAAFQ
jgi:hypothetical protein